jgi:diaminopimelate epimerase
MDIPFYKLAVAGCDFLLINGITAEISEKALPPELILSMCDRRNGIGAEGVILLSAAAEQHVGISSFSGRDGKKRSSGAACMCAARYAFDFGLFSSGRLVIATDSSDLEIHGIGSTLFQIDLGAPVSMENRPIDEDEPLKVEVWMPAGGMPVAYTSLLFPALYENPIAVVVEHLDSQRRLAFGRRPEDAQTPGTSVFATAISSEQIHYRAEREQGLGDCVAEAAAALVALACSGTSTREMTVRNLENTHENELYVTWTGNGNVSVSGVPRYIFTGEYSTEDDDGPDS